MSLSFPTKEYFILSIHIDEWDKWNTLERGDILFRYFNMELDDTVNFQNDLDWITFWIVKDYKM